MKLRLSVGLRLVGLGVLVWGCTESLSAPTDELPPGFRDNPGIQLAVAQVGSWAWETNLSPTDNHYNYGPQAIFSFAYPALVKVTGSGSVTPIINYGANLGQPQGEVWNLTRLGGPATGLHLFYNGTH